MNLIFINELGLDYKNQKQYEFIFSENIIFDYPEEWGDIPSSGKAKSPDIENIDIVATLKDTNVHLDLVQNSDYFGLIDSIDKIVALGWEKFDFDMYENDIERLKFYFGESIESIEHKLNERDLKLNIQKIKES